MARMKCVVNTTTGQTIYIAMTPAEEAQADADAQAAATAAVVYDDARPFNVRATTTSAAAVEVARMTIPLKTGISIDLIAIGSDAGNGNMRKIPVSILAKRLNGSAIMEVGSPVVKYVPPGSPASAIGTPSASVSGNDLVLSVTGVAGRTINWSVKGEIVRFGPEGIVEVSQPDPLP